MFFLSSCYPWAEFRIRLKYLLALLFALILPSLCLADTGSLAEKDYPFHTGEKLTYGLFWEVVPAGTAVLEVLPIEDIAGVKAYHFSITVKTNPALDKIYTVRDYIDSYVDTDFSHTLLYKQKQREGRSKHDITVRVDWNKAQAQYENFGKKSKPISIPPGTFDMLSVFYAFRLHYLAEGMTLEAPVTDGKKCVIGKAHIIDKERIKVADRVYDTLLIKPELKEVGGVFNRGKHSRLEIWITSDRRKIPVRVESKVAVGRFIAELISDK